MDVKEVQEKISRYLRQDDGKLFIERILERRANSERNLRGNTELIEIGRSQGRLEILDLILKMREE